MGITIGMEAAEMGQAAEKAFTHEDLNRIIGERLTKEKEAHKAEVEQLKIDFAVEKALTGARAKNVRAVRVLLDLEKPELAADGTVKGLTEQIKKPQGAEDSKFLFDDGKIRMKGAVPAQSGRESADMPVDIMGMTREERAAYMDANPGMADKAMRSAMGLRG